MVTEVLRDSLFKISVIDNTLLIITISHLITDGSGFKKILYLLASIYSDIDENADYLLNRDFSVLSNKIKSKRKATIKMLFSLIGNYKNPKLLDDDNDKKEFIIEKTIDKQIFLSAHKRTKELGVTINDLFMASFAYAINEIEGIKR